MVAAYPEKGSRTARSIYGKDFHACTIRLDPSARAQTDTPYAIENRNGQVLLAALPIMF